MKRLLRSITPVHLLILALATIAGTSLSGALRGWLVLPLAFVGAVVAVVAGLVAERLRLIVAESVAMSLATFAVVGGFVAGGLPLPGAYADFFGGLTNGWADLLSSVPPSELTPEFRVLPYTVAWLAGVLAVEIARSTRIAGLPVIGPMAGFALGVLFSVENRTLALIQGGLLITLGLALGVYQQREFGYVTDEEIGNTTIARQRRRLLGAGMVLVAIAGAAPLLAPWLPGAESRDRFDLRDRLDPPWDPLAVPSPLAQMKGNFVPEYRDEIVFRATGDVPPRWALATLAAYDGTVWTVGDSEIGGDAPFRAIDDRPPASLWPSQEPAPSVDVEIEIVDLEGHWLPIPGQLEEIHADDPDISLRYNERTGTLATPGLIEEGLSYSVTAIPWRPIDDASMADVTLTSDEQSTEVARQASVGVDTAGDILQGVEPGWSSVAAIRDYLIDDGFYFVEPEAKPGHSAARLADFLGGEIIYGFEEQYAAAAAIIARNSGMSARVVVGFELTDEQRGTSEVEIARSQAAAWIEIRTVEYGWVPVDVTPDRDKEPTIEDDGFQVQNVAAPNPPPPPPPPPELEVEQKVDAEDEDDDEIVEADKPIPTVLLAAGVAGTPTLLMLGLGGGIIGLKRRATKRRRTVGTPADRISGAWRDIADRYFEAGVKLDRALSPAETATLLATDPEDHQRLRQLANVVDRAAFHPQEPPEELVELAWAGRDSTTQALLARHGFGRRWRMRLDPRTLMGRTTR